MPLTTAQTTAAYDKADVVLLVAGPGTGKSRVIEHRVEWLLTEKTSPRAILVLSFTRFASEDLARRIRSHCKSVGLASEADQISVSTAHALALRMLRDAQLLGNFVVSPTVMDSWEADRLFAAEFASFAKVKPARANEITTAYESSWNTLNVNYLQHVTAKEQGYFMAFHGEFKQTYCTMLPGEMVKECLDQIQANVIDPIQLTAAEHLLVDEFQDLNKCDQDFLDRFVRGGAAFFVAGDDDQSLYSFRNAAPDGLVDFDKRYPSRSFHQLPDCFRCTPEVLRHSLQLVSRNHPRIAKTLNSFYAGQHPVLQGEHHVWRFDSQREEARAVAESCAALIGQSIPANQILLLVNSRDTQVPELATALTDAGVPFEGPRGRSLRDSDPGRLAFAFLRILANDDDLVAYRTFLGLYPGIGAGRCVTIREKLKAANLGYKALFTSPLPSGVFTATLANAIEAVSMARATIRGWDMSDTFEDRMDDIAVLLSDVFPAGSSLASQCLDLLKELLDSTLPGASTLEEVLSYFRADGEAQQTLTVQAISDRLGLTGQQKTVPARVRIMTIHGSKGLDAAFVFIPGLETGIMPNRKSLGSPGLIAEQRRALYVGLTRAKLATVVCYAKRRTGRQAKRLSKGWWVSLPPSPFLTEMGATVVDRTGGLNTTEAARLAGEYQRL